MTEEAAQEAQTGQAAEEKRYRAYLTRLSKFVAVAEAEESKDGVVSVGVMRRVLISRGELASFLDEGWEKRVFSDEALFLDVGDKFFKVLVSSDDPENAPSKPSQWEGVRPTEDVLGNTYRRVVGHVSGLEEPSWSDRFLTSPSWRAIHPYAVAGLEYATRRGIEKPLVPLTAYVFDLACGTEDRATQTFALWLVRTRETVDAYTRLRGGEGVVPLTEDELWFHQPMFARADGGPPVEVTAATIAKHLRARLVDRGIIKKN